MTVQTPMTQSTCGEILAPMMVMVVISLPTK